jgi:hypothetical protein
MSSCTVVWLLTSGHRFFFFCNIKYYSTLNLSRQTKKKIIWTKSEVLSLMEKIGGKAKWERLCSFLAVFLGVLKTLSQTDTARHADVTYHVWKPWTCSFTGKKSSLPKVSWAEQIAFEIKECFPAGRFLYYNAAFWQKNSARFPAISLQLLKLLSIKKR